MGKVDFKLVRRRIRTVVETELAVVAFVHDSAMILGRQLPHIAFVAVDTIEQRVERRAEIETTAATVADLVDTQCFFVQLRGTDRLDEGETSHGRNNGKAVSNQPSARGDILRADS
jgi:hypothetical protein